MEEKECFYLKIVRGFSNWGGESIFDPFPEGDGECGIHLMYVVNYYHTKDRWGRVVILNVYDFDIRIEPESEFMERNPYRNNQTTTLYFESECMGPAFRINIMQLDGITLTGVLQGWGKSGLKSRFELWK